MATTGTTTDTVNAPIPGAPSECTIVRVGVVVVVEVGVVVGRGVEVGRRVLVEVGIYRDGGLGMGSNLLLYC